MPAKALCANYSHGWQFWMADIYGDAFANNFGGTDAADRMCRLYGKGGNDTLSGDTFADDHLSSHALFVIMLGGKGNDHLNVAPKAQGHGDDVLTGGDLIYGGDAGDTLTGDAGADTQIGGTGADVFVYAKVQDIAQDMIVHFVTGVDTVDLYGIAVLHFTGGLISETTGELRFDTGLMQLQVVLDGDGVADASVQFDTVNFLAGDLVLWNTRGDIGAPYFKRNPAMDFNEIAGTNKGLRLHGTVRRDLILAAGGNDTAVGWVGNDRMYGEKGDDILYGQTGNDTLYGGLGADEMHLDEFNQGFTDHLYGVAGNDRVFSEDMADFSYGAAVATL